MSEESPAWAHGFGLELLKELAAPFRDCFKPYIFGAFGMPKERDVAAAHHARSFIFSRDAGGRVVAACIFNLLKADAIHHDFIGRAIRIPKGRIIIKHLAIYPEAIEEKLPKILSRLETPGGLWAEIHQENEPLKAALLRAGFQYAGTKIAAASELIGIYFKNDKPPAFPFRAHPAEAAAQLKLKDAFITIPQREWILQELRAYEEKMSAEAWAQHYSNYNKRQSWTAFALRGFDAANPGFIIKPSEMSEKWKAENAERLKARAGETIAAPHFPQTMSILAARLPGTGIERLRFMRLAAGGELTRHADITDREAGIRDGKIARLHIPLITNDDCLFSGWDAFGGKREMIFPARSLCYLDQRKPHAVKNGGDEDRIHIVADVYADERLREMLAAAMPALIPL